MPLQLLTDIPQALGSSVKTMVTCRERLETRLGFDIARALDRLAALHAPSAAPTR